MAARLRKETLPSLESIAARLRLGTSQSPNATLHSWMRSAGERAVHSKETNSTEGTKRKILNLTGPLTGSLADPPFTLDPVNRCPVRVR